MPRRLGNITFLVSDFEWTKGSPRARTVWLIHRTNTGTFLVSIHRWTDNLSKEYYCYIRRRNGHYFSNVMFRWVHGLSNIPTPMLVHDTVSQDQATVKPGREGHHAPGIIYKIKYSFMNVYNYFWKQPS